jgi:DNA-binding protein YbaB
MKGVLIMEEKFFEWLDAVAPGMSLFLSVIIVCGGAILTCYKVLKKEIKKHDEEIAEKIRDRASEEEFKNQMKELAEDFKEMKNNMNDMHSEIMEMKTDIYNNLNMVIESDKESNRLSIVSSYYDAMEKGYIEVYLLQALEYRYERYLDENGDSFIENLMVELRKLPHEPPEKTNRHKPLREEE